MSQTARTHSPQPARTRTGARSARSGGPLARRRPAVSRALSWAVLWAAALLAGICGPAGFGLTDRLTPAPDLRARAHDTGRPLAPGLPAGAPHLVLLARTPGSVDDPAAADAGRRLARLLARDRAVLRVTSYWTEGPPGLRSGDGRPALVRVWLRGDARAVIAAARRLAPSLRGVHGPLSVEVGGRATAWDETWRRGVRDLHATVLLAALLAVVVAPIAARGVVAGQPPLAAGLFALLTAMAALRVAAGLMPLPVPAPAIALPLALALPVVLGPRLPDRPRARLLACLSAALAAAVAAVPLLITAMPLARPIAVACLVAVACALAAGGIVLPAAAAVMRRRPGLPTM